jgi:hypothetical protein
MAPANQNRGVQLAITNLYWKMTIGNRKTDSKNNDKRNVQLSKKRKTDEYIMTSEEFFKLTFKQELTSRTLKKLKPCISPESLSHKLSQGFNSRSWT